MPGLCAFATRLILTLGLSACGSLPELPHLATGALTSVAPSLEMSSVNATETYTRLARGANSCWFGAQGPLAKAYIMHAVARSATDGGDAEIAIHERDFSSPHPWGYTAFRITLTPFGNGVTQVGAENRSMPAGSRVPCAATSGDGLRAS